MKKMLIIDSNSLINRAFYGVRFLSSADGTPTNAIYGFLMMLLKLIDEHKPDYIIAAFDLKAPTFRHKMFDGYKAQRHPMPDELAVQMPLARSIIDSMGIMRLEMEGYEADDIIGTVSRICGEREIGCLIATGDKDDLQLADDYTNILLTTTKSGKTETERYGADEVFARYGVTPTEFIDVKALMGDASDNIPGVSGIGEKTATALIAQYKSIENIYNDFEKHCFKGAVCKKLAEGRESAFLSKKLATIDKYVPIEFSFEEASGGIDKSPELFEMLTRLGLNSIVKRLDFPETVTQELATENPLADCKKRKITDRTELDALIERIYENERAAYCIDASDDRINAVAIAIGSDGYIIEDGVLVEEFTPVLRDKKAKKILFDAKKTIVNLAKILRPEGICYDVSIASYLINPSRSEYSVSSLAGEYFGIAPTEKRKGQISLFDEEVDSDEILNETLLLEPLYRKTLDLLEKGGMKKLYFDVELPLSAVLADMQIEGMYVDKERLKAFGAMLGERIAELTETIYEMAGGEFNINSPKQLGEVLFERLGLHSGKKTKKGYSTGADVLESLRDKHPIIDAVLEYRRATKLKSTYCDGLSAVISSETGRIHSVFNQTVTVTGRISSTEPNLQNIPTRTELGREIRKMFVAGEGKIFVDADYSQIELRVLSAIVDDKAMKEAFMNGVDIHTETAAQVLNIKPEEVTKEQRSAAKAVNFGIVYGISEFSLAKDLKISVKAAREYINSYLEHYSGVREYMKRIKEEAKRDGYVRTLMNRIRYIPELKSSNYNMRMFGERVALNTPIQGSAADIIKLAMVRVHNRLAEEGLKARLVLQVHDELIVEAPPEEESRVREILKTEMENAVNIGVPLVVDMESGRSWYDCK